MANEKVNKVVLGNETLIDLTGDTVTANNLLSGATAHDSRGEQIQGAVTVPTQLDDLSDVNASSPASGDVLFRDGTEWINKNITRVVTKAQYDALVQAGTVDPDVNYFVTDMGVTGVPIDDDDISPNKVWSSEKIGKYSTTEKVVGEWIDGKPLYRKSYYASGTISDGTVLDSNITSNNCKIRSIKETYYSGTVYNGRTDATPIGASTRTYFMCSIGDSSVFLQLSTTISEYNVTIEYTKNTD